MNRDVLVACRGYWEIAEIILYVDVDCVCFIADLTLLS